MLGTIKEDSPLLALPLIAGLGVFMTIGNIWLAFLVTVLVVGAIALHGHGRLVPLLGGVWGVVQTLRAKLAGFKTDKLPTPKGQIHLGRNLDTGEKFTLDMTAPSSLGTYAQTGGGKSTLIETILAEIATQCSPSDLKLCISDPSNVDYRIWKRLPHLAYPVVDVEGTLGMLQWAQQQMVKRQALFNSMPQDRKCNNLDLYHKLRDELRLDVPRLPVIVVILDEIQDITKPGSPAEEIVTDIAKTGRKFGVVVWGITQRNTVDSISRGIQQQQPWKLIGHMADSQDYGNVARVPKDVYTRMRKQPGRFMALVDDGWCHIQVKMFKTKRVEQIARTHRIGGDVPYPSTAQTAVAAPQVKQAWTGSNSQKIAMIMQWLNQQPTKPTPQDFTEAFDASENTGRTWIDRHWPKVEKLRAKSNET